MKKIRDWTQTLVLALLLSLGIRTYVAEAVWIPSESMLPTLEVGDRLLVEKITYKLNGVSRGDIIVFQPPPASRLDEVMIKRVLGLPGDNVAIKEGVVCINGSPMEEPYELEKPRYDFNAFVVPEDSVFVLGDNRNNSYDSRYWGVVPMELIIGKAWACYYPIAHATLY